MCRHRITDPEAINNFVYGGKATFTIVSKRTSSHFTYTLRRAPGGKAGHPWFVFVLTGTNNEADYTYAGFIDPAQPYKVIQGRKGRISNSAPSIAGLEWALDAIHNGRSNRLDRFELWHEGRCGVCGRRLTVPESIASGIGPVCAAQFSGAGDGDLDQQATDEREMQHMEEEADRAHTIREEIDKQHTRDIRECFEMSHFGFNVGDQVHWDGSGDPFYPRIYHGKITELCSQYARVKDDGWGAVSAVAYSKLKRGYRCNSCYNNACHNVHAPSKLL